MRKRRKENGIALLISIFVLLLISVVAIALVVSSGTETAIAGNYRSATGVYYAALSGLEEARGRFLRNNPDYVLKADANFLPPPGTPLAIGDVRYIFNPNPALNENMGNMLTLYPDNEYATEFGAGPTPSRPPIASVSPNNAQGIPGPPFKWVRINAVSEKSLNVDVDADGLADSTTPLYFDNTSRRFSNNSGAGPQVLEITSLAVLPNPSGQSSQKLVQYLVASGPLTLPPFLSSAPLAALSLSGSPGVNSPAFHAPGTNAVYAVKGDDSLQGCSGSLGSPVAAIGLFGDYSGSSYISDLGNMVGGIPLSPASVRQSYTGVNSAPDVEYLTSYPASMMSPAQVDAIAQNIIQNADAAFVPAGSSATQTAYLTSLNMSSTNIMTVIADGDLDISNWSHNGYGLLLVTGTFSYDPDTNWNGIVLVIGQGIVNNSQNGQNKQISGAMLVARTRDPSGNLLTGRIGGARVQFQDGMGGTGIRYSSCWVQKAQPTGSYKILSFHEISQ